MDWLAQATARQGELIDDLQQLIRIESVLNEQEATAQQPFGKGPNEALHWLLARGEAQGMTVKNIDEMAGHIEMGHGDELVGILCHVDVVPAGDESTWTYPPFEGVIEDGKLFGRGAIDDKGPTMAAWLAMKMIKDANIPLNKRVRMIIGTDEESGFRCVDRYFATEELPSIGFAPDADFPLINAEKGIADLLFTSQAEGKEQIITFKAGHRTNMVPELATAQVHHLQHSEQAYHQFLQDQALTGTVETKDGVTTFTLKGKSAHAMEPHNGINAAIKLAEFLHPYMQELASRNFTSFMVTAFGKDCYGTALDLAYEDEASGHTTLNPGIIHFAHNKAEIQVSMRYSVTYPFAERLAGAQAKIHALSFAFDIVSNSPPHYVEADAPLVKTLERIYRKYSGDQTTPLLSTGGGTYARAMAEKGENVACVAYGMLFPGEPDVMHQADEFVVIDNVIKAAAIYAEAIVALATN